MAALAATCWFPAALSFRASALRAGAVSRGLTLSSSSSASSCALRSDFTSAKLASAFSSCEISGSALLPSSLAPGVPQRQSRGLVVRAGGTSLGCTKRHASRKKRARVSGFRVRMSTNDGINVLKRRRARGRKELVTQSSSRSGKRA